MQGSRDRRRASALQQALERYERMLADGLDPAESRASAAAGLDGTDARALGIAAGLREAADRVIVEPDPAFMEAFADRLRTSELVVRPRPTVLKPRFAFVPMAAAACVMVLAGILVPTLQSLPGERLYGLKGVTEDARLAFAFGATEARVRLDLAGERLSEVEELIERSRTVALRAIGVHAAGLPSDITDPDLVALIEDTLREAGHHLEAAAEILTKHPTHAQDLDDLVAVSRRGHALATELAQDLPRRTQPPVLDTVVKLAKIEAAAKAARTQVEVEPTPPPCAKPTPTPTPAPTGTPDESGNATSTAVATDPPRRSGVEELSTPDPTPCISPKPTPTAEPTDTPSPEPSSEPTATPGVDEGVDPASGGEDVGSGEADNATEQSGTEPHSA